MRSNPLKFLWIWQDYLRPSFWQIFAERIFASHPKRRAEYRRPHTQHQKAKKEQTMGHATLSHPSHMFRRHVKDIERCQSSWAIDSSSIFLSLASNMLQQLWMWRHTAKKLPELWVVHCGSTTPLILKNGWLFEAWSTYSGTFQLGDSTRAKSSWPLTIAQKSSNNIKELQETKKKPWEFTELQNTWLVGGFNHLEKYEFVNGKD